MSRQAQAERERQARVILGDGGGAGIRQFAEASRSITTIRSHYICAG